jgi:hypothetical protein
MRGMITDTYILYFNSEQRMRHEFMYTYQNHMAKEPHGKKMNFGRKSYWAVHLGLYRIGQQCSLLANSIQV